MTNARSMVREIVLARASTPDFDDATALGEGGLGLDSIAVAEVLLECEDRLGVSMSGLLDGRPITVARLVSQAGGVLVS